MSWQKVRRADGLHCSYCNQLVDSDASSCPGCGKELAPPAPELKHGDHSDHSPATSAKPTPKLTDAQVFDRASARTQRNLAIGCGVTLGLFLALFAVCALLSEGKTGKRGGPDKIVAWLMSQKFVKDGLKAPATASFPSYDESYVTDLGGGRFRVDAYVDAENSFGAKLRSRFTCTLNTKDGDT